MLLREDEVKKWVEQHIEQWKRNRRLGASLCTDHPEWCVTILFYAALHAVNAMLARDGYVPETHTERDRLLMQSQAYRPLYAWYKQFRDLATTARYVADRGRWVPAHKIEGSVIKLMKRPVELEQLEFHTGLR